MSFVKTAIVWTSLICIRPNNSNNNKRRIYTRLLTYLIVIYIKILIFNTLYPTIINIHNSTMEHKQLILTNIRIQCSPISRLNNSLAMATSERINQTCSQCKIHRWNHTNKLWKFLHLVAPLTSASQLNLVAPLAKANMLHLVAHLACLSQK